MQAHIGDGIKFVKEVKNVEPSDRVPIISTQNDASGSPSASNGSGIVSDSVGSKRAGIDVLIIDADSSDSRFVCMCIYMCLCVCFLMMLSKC